MINRDMPAHPTEKTVQGAVSNGLSKRETAALHIYCSECLSAFPISALGAGMDTRAQRAVEAANALFDELES